MEIALFEPAQPLPGFNYLSPVSDQKKELVDQNSASWNRVMLWMRQLESLRRAS